MDTFIISVRPWNIVVIVFAVLILYALYYGFVRIGVAIKNAAGKGGSATAQNPSPAMAWGPSY